MSSSSLSTTSSSGDAWSPSQYHLFENARKRGPIDLFARLPKLTISPKLIVDLGCGSGELTLQLAQHHSVVSALSDGDTPIDVIGVDSSPNMLKEARLKLEKGKTNASEAEKLKHAHIQFVQADFATFKPTSPVSLLFSSAALHWVPSHSSLIPHLFTSLVAPNGGLFAFTVPGNFSAPTHTTMFDALCAIGAVSPPRKSEVEMSEEEKQRFLPARSESAELYHRLLEPYADYIDCWETTYMHDLLANVPTDADPLSIHPACEWTKGSAAGVLLERLDRSHHGPFLTEYVKRLHAAYPCSTLLHPTTRQTVLKALVPFKRIFVIARRK